MTANMDAVLNEVEQAQATTTPSEREKRIVTCFQKWEAARKVLVDERKKANEKVQAANANLRAAVEQGVAQGDVAAQLNKLSAISIAWQDLGEARSEKTELIKSAREVVSNAESKLREAVEQSAQLSLFDAEARGGDAPEETATAA